MTLADLQSISCALYLCVAAFAFFVLFALYQSWRARRRHMLRGEDLAEVARTYGLDQRYDESDAAFRERAKAHIKGTARRDGHGCSDT